MAKLPILMYHSVSVNPEDSLGLTVSTKRFEAHLHYLKSEGYTSFHFKDLEQFHLKSNLPKKSLIITFDDVYVNQLELAVPLLEAYGFKACFYIPFKYVGGTNAWDEGAKPIMSIAQLKSLNPEVVELGMHSYAHGNYKTMTVEAIEEDFDKSFQFLEKNNLEVHSTLAYPYGKYPKMRSEKSNFFKVLKQNDIKYGLRIGNRVNTFPFKNPFEIQRIDIKGEDSIKTFKRKLKFGKRRLF